MRYASVDPATGRLLAEFETASRDEVERAVRAAVLAAAQARGQAPEARVPALTRLAGLLEGAVPALAQTAAREMGKVLAEGEAEVRKCAAACRWFAAHGPSLLVEEGRATEAGRAHVRFDPLGPLLALMPWNFPYWQVVRFAVPALLAGNTVLLKHAPSTPRCALALATLFAEAGFGPGAFESLFLSEAQAAQLIADPRVRGVTLTGSTRAGREVAALAGRHLKPCVLELGGSDPFVVFADADLAAAAAAAVTARCQNAGQSCIAGKRFLVERAAYAGFAQAFVEGMQRRRLGPPCQPGTELGPLAREDLRDALARQVEDSVAAGAVALCGGRRLEGPGWYYPPTVLERVPDAAPAAREELFGPVAVLAPFGDEREAAALANATSYGLGASVWTDDPARARRMAAALEAGSVFVNGITRSDPRLPFGGVRDSGYGRELGLEGARAFTNPKTVWIA